eukprot:SRR837773.8264.p3 GENE.SRR837773.8264~~SRR837773.8264.p3  ORF type:complete len:162 (+),score=55.04 SRR837773.8264:30-488(+)
MDSTEVAVWKPLAMSANTQLFISDKSQGSLNIYMTWQDGKPHFALGPIKDKNIGFGAGFYSYEENRPMQVLTQLNIPGGTHCKGQPMHSTLLLKSSRDPRYIEVSRVTSEVRNHLAACDQKFNEGIMTYVAAAAGIAAGTNAVAVPRRRHRL